MAKYIEKSKLEKEILNWAICLNNPDTLSRSDTIGSALFATQLQFM